MFEFDAANYFDRRAYNDLNAVEGGISKREQIKAASEQKIAELNKMREADKQSLFGGYSQGGVLDTAVATLASPITQTGNALASALEMHNEANETNPVASEQTKAAAQKIREALNMDSLVGINPETGERTSSLHRRILGDAAIAAVQGSASAVQGAVGIGSMVSGGRIGQAANEMGFRPKEGISILEGYLSPEMRKANQQVSDAEGFTGTVDEILSNPSTIPSNIIKSVPSMILGGAVGKAVGLLPMIGSGLAGAIGEGTMMAGSQAENIREQTADGRLTLKQALLAAGTGVMGAGVGFAGNKLAGALRIGDIDEALVTGAMAKSPRGAFAKTLLTGGVEGGEELFQSTGEQVAQNLALDKPYDQGVGSAAALGLFTGAPMGAVAGLSGGAQAKQAETAEAKATFAAAVATNDPSAYLDPKSRTYNPTKAVEVLFATTRKADTTAEVRQENLTKVRDIVANLEEAQGQASLAYARASNPAFDKVTTQTQLTAFKERLAALDVADPANEKMAAGLGEAIQLHEITLAASESKTALKLQKAKADGLAKQITQTTNVRDELAKLVRGKTSVDEVRDAVIAANVTVDVNDAPAVEAAQAAVNKVISLSMVNLNNLTAEVADGLASNTANALTDPQREYLRQFSKARLAENTLKTLSDVSRDIYQGNPGGSGKTRMLGVKDYNKNIGLALEAKDVKAADYQLELLSNFTQDHKDKAELISNTFNKVKVGLLPDSQVHKTDTGWVLVSNAKQFLTKPELKANGGLEIHRQSAELVSNTVKEATALQQVLTAQQEAYNLTFPNTPSAVATNATQAPSVGEAVAPGAAVVGGATQPNTFTDVQKVNISTEPVQKTGNSVQVKPVAQTAAAPSSVAPVVPAVQSAASPLSKNVSVLENAEDKARVSVKSLPLSAVEGDTNYSEIYSTLSILFSESTPEEQQALVDAFTNEQEQSNESTQASQTQDSTTSQDPESTGSIQDAATGQTSEVVGELQSQDSQASEDGKLGLFSQYPEKLTGTVNEVFRTVNLVAQYFKQTGVNETNLANKPLVGVKGFLSAWDKDFDLVKQYLDLGKDNTLFEEQESALKNMASTMKSWMPAIQANFKKFTGSVDFKSNDMMQYLYTEDGALDVDENVKTAIAYAAYRWIMDRANSPIFMEPEQVKDMHNVDEDANIDPIGLATLRRMSSFKDTAIAELGKVAAQALGLALLDDAPVDLLPKLESALGAHVLDLLDTKGYLRLDSIPVTEVNAWFDVEVPAQHGDKTTYDYVRLLTQKEGKKTIHIDKVSRIKAANYGSRDVINKLFGVTVAPRMPDTKPSKLVQKTAKDSQQDIPKAERKAVQDTMNVPHTIIQDMWAVAQMLGRDAILKIAGAKDLESGKYHEINRSSIEAQNQNLGTQYDMQDELLHQSSNENGFEQAFYPTQSVWKNFRAGFSNQAMNLQTSKIHRFMFARPNWTVKIDLDNQPLVDEFLVSIAMAMGIKTDQQRNASTLPKFGTYLLENPRVLEAVQLLKEALKAGSTELLSHQAIEKIQDVAANAEGMMSLQAMVAFGKYLQALEDGKPDFTVTLLVGADGKTNGPMLTLLALGADGFDTLNRGGFYSTEEGQPKHFSEYFEDDKAMDLYQDLGMNVLASAKQLVVSAETIQKLHNAKKHKEAYSLSTIEQFSAFQVLTKALDKDGKVTSAMRNLVKTPLTSFFFGSVMKASVKGMEEKFIEGFYTTIEDLAQGKRTDTTLVEFIKATNILIAKGNYKAPRYSEKLDIEQMLTMKHALSPVQEAALRKSFNVIMGNPVKVTMENYFQTFIDRRNKLNKTIQSSWETYAAVYADAYNAELDSLMEAGKIAYREVIKGADKGKKIPLHGLTVAQEKVLRLKISNILPVMHTAYSKEEDNIRAGIYMGKTEVDKSKSPIYSNNIITSKGKVPTQSHVRKEISPGVAGLSYSIHSLDSSVMHKALNAVPETMNVHDEGANGVDKIVDVATALNKATIENLLEYSPAHEAVVMLERLVTGLAQRVKDGLTSKEAVKAVFESWVSTHNRNLPEEDKVFVEDIGFVMINQAVQNAYQADLVRLTNISQMGYVDQYTWEGGQFEVKQEIRDRATALLGDLDKKPSMDLVEAMRYLNKVRSEAETSSMEVPAELEMEQAPVVNEPEPVTPKMSDWGSLGEPAVESDPALVAMFANNKVLTGKAVIGSLLKQLGQSDSAFDKAMVLILKQIQSIIPNTMTVTYVTSDTQFDREIHANPSNSRGWYVPQGKGQGIYLLGNEFAASNLQVETVIHELLHAVLLHATENPDKSPAAAKLVAELETLLAKVTAEVKDTKFKDAITDVHELISWGLTNREFQTDVLMKIKMETKTKGNPLITGMAKLFNSITDFLFDGLGLTRKQVAINGLSILTANVSGLFQEAATNQGPVQVEAKSQVNLLNTHTTEDLYDALDTGEVSSEFGEFHKQILSKIVNKVFGPYGSFRDAIMKNTPQGALQVFTESLISGVAPFASKLLGSGIKINNQEAFVIEQVEATVAYGLSMGGKDSRTSVVRNELLKLYRDMADRLKPTDRNDGSPESLLYNTVFNAKEDDFLAKFAAMGMGHEQFNSLLKVATKKSVKILADNSPIGILTRLFSTILEAINGKLTLTFGGQQADQKLAGLVQTLVVLEQKREIVKNSVAPDWQVFLDEKARDTRKGAKSTLNTLINSSMFKKNKNVFIKAGSNLFDVVTAPGRIKVFSANLGKIRDNHFTGLPGVVSGVFNDMKGHKPSIELLLRAVKHHEGLRKQAIELTNGSVLESFEDGHKISNESKGALTKVALRTGAHVLLDQFTPAQLENLVKDPAALQTEIDLLEAKLRKDYKAVYSSYFLDNARALAYQLATGRAVIAHLLRNAHNIASMFGSPYSGQLTEAQVTAATKDLDTLVSMYGMKYSKPTDLALFADLLATENARTDGGNGVQMALLQHKMLEEQSLERLFDGNPVLMRKGYMPEVYNPHTDLQAANEEQGKILMAQGYVQGAFVSQDPDEKDAEPLRLYTLRDGGLLPWQSGITSMTNLRSAGTKHHGDRAVGTQKSMMAAKQGAINKLHRSGGTLDPTKIKESYTVPLLNDKGVAVNYVHLMEERTKDELLERDSRFDTVLGVLAGSIFDKENSPKNNRKAVQLLRDEYDLGFEKDSVAFLEVSDTSTYPELREIYRMMPDSMKESIREIWGEDGMKVRADTLDIMFGYRELSLSTVFDKAADERNHLEQAMVWTITTLLRQHAKRKLNMTNAEAEIYSQRGAVVVRRAENVWHALVKLTKDIFVVKSGITMLGNIMSNKTTLMLYGVPFKDILANSKIAWESAEDYARDNKELFRLQNQLDTGYIMGSTADLEERVAQLKDSLANNPVSKLIDAGLMPTIAEDMEAQDDDFDYKPGFVIKAEKMLDKLNPTVRETANQALMGHSTRGYKTLSRLTQLSDFTARYVLYQHLISLKEDPMTSAEAIQEASEAFVNYDIPLHRKLHYLDKMGFLMFTKYFLRIQRVIRGRFREAPGKVMLLMAAQSYFSWLPSIIDSSMLIRFGNNPLNSGALQFFTAGDDILTMKAALSIVKP